MTKNERIEVPDGQRVESGRRLKQRREQVGLSASSVAAAADVSVPGVYKWERDGMPATLRIAKVAALEAVLKTSRHWLLFGEQTEAESCTEQARAVHGTPISINNETLIEAIRAVGDIAASGRDGFRRVSLSAKGQRNAAIFAQRYGDLGSEASTLEAIGIAHGITRQRTQQIAEKMTESAGALAYQIPVVDLLRAHLGDLLPAPLRELTAQLKSLLGDGLEIADANRFCIEILGVRLFAVTERKTGPHYDRFEPLAVSTDSSEEDGAWAKEVHAHALDMIRAAGAAHLGTVIGQALLAGVRFDATRVVGALKSNKGFDWLSERDGWFWFGEGIPARNPLLKMTREVLTASSGRVDIDEILGGMTTVQSSWSRNKEDPRLALAIGPPIHVVRALLDQVPWVARIQYNDYFLCEDAEPAALSEGEKLLFAMLNETGGIASRSMLQSRLVGTGGKMPSVTLSFVLETSPIFRQVTRGVVGVRGREYPVRAVLMALETTYGRSPFMATRSSIVSFPFEMTAFAARQNVCVAPAGVVPMLEEGAYNVEGTNATIDLVQRASGVFALNRAVQCMVELGVEVGQTVEIAVDREEKVVSFQQIDPGNS